jgi:hypothetical protein
MSRWYYSSNGKAEGPVSEEFLLEGLQSGRFKPLDLIFHEGDVAWKTFGEVDVFRDSLESLPPVGMQCPLTGKSTEQVYSWVVLRKKGSSFVQSGPYSHEQVASRIGGGDISYSDYIWRPGYKRWVRIGNLPDFDRRARDRDGDPVNKVIPLPDEKPEIHGPDAPGAQGTEIDQQAMENVMRLDRTRLSPPSPALSYDFDEFTGTCLPQPLPGAPQSGVVPQEVAEKSIAKAQSRLAMSEQAASLSQNVEEVSQNISHAPDAAAETPVAKSHSGRRARLALAASVAFLVIVASLYIFDHAVKPEIDGMSRRTASVENNHSSVTAQPRQAASVPEAKPAESISAEPKAASLPPSAEDPNLATDPTGQSLESRPGVPTSSQPSPASSQTAIVEIVPLKMESAPQIALQTNAAVGAKITVSVKSVPGGVLQSASFERSLELTRGPGEIPTVDLQSWGLARGEYVVEVGVGEVKVAKKVFVGHRDAAFEAELKKFRGDMALSQQDEKKLLMIVSRRYEDLTRDLGAGFVSARKSAAAAGKWSRFYADWRKQSELAGTSLKRVFETEGTSTFFYPDEMQNLKGTIDRLYEKAREMDGVIKADAPQNRRVASEFDTAELQNAFKLIREQATRLK